MKESFLANLKTHCRLLAVLGGLAFYPLAASADIAIDPEWPTLPPEPLTLPIPYTFDGGGWTTDQKDSGRAALSYLGSWFVGQPAFVEEASPSDFSIRWGDAGFFKDWGMHGVWDLNFAGALAVAAKPAIGANAPWDQKVYPLGEIYFNLRKINQPYQIGGKYEGAFKNANNHERSMAVISGNASGYIGHFACNDILT